MQPTPETTATTSAPPTRFVLRKARLADVPRFLEIKEELRIDRAGAEAQREGFLLGSSAEEYAALILAGIAIVAAAKGEDTAVGFGIALPWEVLSASEVWHKRAEAAWHPGGLAEIESGRPGYVEQLAVPPSKPFRHLAPALGMALVEALADAGHTHILATTVLEPMRNEAALKLLALMGSREVGRIEEEYPQGRILSAIHCAPVAGYTALKAGADWNARLLRYLKRSALERST